MAETMYNFLYLRLSREDGDDDGRSDESQSIGSQRTCLREFVYTHGLQHLHFEEVIDDGYSGTHFERPGIKRILKLVELGKVQTIIVRDLSRFARNYLDAGEYLEYIFPGYGVRFISINDGYDSADYQDTTAGLHIAIKNLINQMYSRDISKKIKSAVDMKKMNGEFVYGTAPYGYKKGPQKNTIVIDDEAALVVRRIFRLACDGVTITQIAQILNSEGIPTPSVHLSKVRSKNYIPRAVWTFESIRNIITNRIYTGDTVPFKSHVVKLGSDRVKMIPEEERIVIENTHEPIITREMYFQARLIIKSCKKSARKGSTSVLNSYLVCGCCGNKLFKGKVQNKSFLCSTARYNPESECKQIRVWEEAMKGVILRAIHQQCLVMDAHIKSARSSLKAGRNESDEIKIKLRFLKRELEGVQTAKMELYEKYISSTLLKEEYLEKKISLNEKEQEIKSEIAMHEEMLTRLTSSEDTETAIAEEESLVVKYSGISELTEPLMRELIQKIIVYPNGAINIVWNFKNAIESDVTQVI